MAHILLLKGPTKRTPEDATRFEESLERLVQKSNRPLQRYSNRQDAYQDMLSDMKTFPRIPQPVKGQVAGQYGGLHTKDFCPDNFFCHSNDPCLQDTVCTDFRIAGCIPIQVL